MNPSDFAAALPHSMKHHDDEPEPPRSKLAPDIEAVRLRDAFIAFYTPHNFEPGMIVRQKPQASLYNSSGDNGLAIVIEILPLPIIDGEQSPRSSGYRHRLDIIIGSIEQGHDGGDVFALFHVDSRRFEPVPAAELALAVKPVADAETDAETAQMWAVKELTWQDDAPGRAGPPTPRRTAAAPSGEAGDASEGDAAA